jgi:hypothetical protein
MIKVEQQKNIIMMCANQSIYKKRIKTLFLKIKKKNKQTWLNIFISGKI